MKELFEFLTKLKELISIAVDKEIEELESFGEGVSNG